MSTKQITLSVGNVNLSLEIPESTWVAANSVESTNIRVSVYDQLGETLNAALRRALPREMTPPTVAQDAYLNRIARVLKIKPRESTYASAEKCGNFITKHELDFTFLNNVVREFYQSQKPTFSLATKINKGFIAESLKEQEKSIVYILEFFGVKQAKTIDSYILAKNDYLEGKVENSELIKHILAAMSIEDGDMVAETLWTLFEEHAGVKCDYKAIIEMIDQGQLPPFVSTKK